MVPLLALSACGGAQDDAVESAADRFYAALDADDGATACALLSARTRDELEQSAGESCDEAVLEEDLTVAVLGNLEIDRGEELGIAERARPTALQHVARNALFNHFERRDEFGLEQAAAASLIGKCRQRFRQVEIAGNRAISGFVSEDRDHDARRDARPLLDPRQ